MWCIPRGERLLHGLRQSQVKIGPEARATRKEANSGAGSGHLGLGTVNARQGPGKEPYW